MTESAVKNESSIDIQDMPQAQDKPPIFVVGGGRSGTTLMRYMLNAHPNIYIMEEAGFYMWAGTKNKGDEAKQIKKFLKSFSFAWLRIPARTVFERAMAAKGDKLKAAFIATMSEKAATYQRTRYGEKNPLYLACLDKVIEDFPGAPIINVVRDPRAQVYSHLTMPFSTPSLLIANFLNKMNYKLVKKQQEHIYNVKLEDLVADPKAVMTKLLDYVDEPWSDRVLEHQKHLLEDDGIPFPWLKEAAGSRKVKKKKWRDALSPAWVRITESWQKQAFEEFGYEPLKLEKEPGFFAKCFAILSDIPVALYSILRALVLFVKIGATDDSDANTLQRLLHSFNPKAWTYHDNWDGKLPPPPPISESMS